jgi:SAM-dependent methyltransferase
MKKEPGKQVARTNANLRLMVALDRGTTEHYLDAALYDHEYKRRRDDVRHYLELAEKTEGPILELGCGTGRLLVPLVRADHQVTGVDLSSAMLARCRERLAKLSAAARGRAELVEGDFRHVELRRRFPLIVCPFNAFMHLYERRDVERFLASVKRHLSKGGLFAFDVMNPDLKWLSRDPRKRWARTSFCHPTTGKRMTYSTDLSWDGALQIAFMRIYYEDQTPDAKRRRSKVVHLSHRYFFPLELEALLHYNGFVIEQAAGDFSGSPLCSESEEQVYLCRVA